jgi:hypothetical protein
MPKTPVYFSCRHCDQMYVASQEIRPAAGCFNCLDCAKPVHEWSGPYGFTDWKRALPAYGGTA